VSHPIFKTAKDKALFEKWNKKLDKYDDCNAEDFTGHTPLLRSWHNFKFKKIKPDDMERVSSYYAECREILQHCDFPSKLHKEIWSHYAEGLPLRDIEEKINHKRGKDAISRYIKEVIKYVRSQDRSKTG